MSEILFLAHRVPFPPDRGDKIRSHHVLRRLAEIAPVHVGTFGESDDDMSHGPALAAVAESHCLVRRSKPLWAAGIEALAKREPVSLAAFRDEAIGQWVRRTIAERPISAIYVFSGQMGQYVPADFTGRVVLDLVDVDSAKFEAYARDGGFPRNWIDAREARLLAREEAQMAANADVTLLVSEEEAELFRSRCGPAPEVHAMGNGIDAERFDPATVVGHPALADGGPHLVFAGQMDYPPNVAAARRVAHRLLPAIRYLHPEAQFHIVGRAPPPVLTRLDGANGVRVWGTVPDMRPYVAGADLVIAPLEIARGVQNKLLEAMAAGRPILATSGAATGLGAIPGKHLRVADEDRALIAAALELLDGRGNAEAMGQAARRFVVKNRSWTAMLARLPEYVGFAPREAPSEARARDAA